MAQNNIATHKGNTQKSNRRKKCDSSDPLPVVVGDQSNVAKDTKAVAKSNKVVTNCDHLLTITPIEEMIITLRGVQVIVDRDLATLYGVETKSLNQARSISKTKMTEIGPRYGMYL